MSFPVVVDSATDSSFDHMLTWGKGVARIHKSAVPLLFSIVLANGLIALVTHIRDLVWALSLQDVAPRVLFHYQTQLLCVIFLSGSLVVVSFGMMLRKRWHRILKSLLLYASLLPFIIIIILRDNFFLYGIMYANQDLSWKHRLLVPARDFLAFSFISFLAMFCLWKWNRKEGTPMKKIVSTEQAIR
jgi:hypothetical protein